MQAAGRGRENSPLLGQSRRRKWPLLMAAVAGTLALALVLGIAMVMRGRNQLELVERGAAHAKGVHPAFSGTLKHRRMAAAEYSHGEKVAMQIASVGVHELAEFGDWGTQLENETNAENKYDYEEEHLWWKHIMNSTWVGHNIVVDWADVQLCGEDGYNPTYRHWQCDGKSLWAIVGMGCSFGYTDPNYPYCRPKDEVVMMFLVASLVLFVLIFLACFFCGCCHRLRGS